MRLGIMHADVLVAITDRGTVPRYAPESWLAHRPDAETPVRLEQANVIIIDGEVESVSLKGRVLTKTGEPDKRHNILSGVLGHYQLERQIGAQVLAMLKAELSVEHENFDSNPLGFKFSPEEG